MMLGKLLHPDILSALARAGHGSRVLIADANYPCATKSPPSARQVFLNLRPGLVQAKDVVMVVGEAVPIEAATVMEPPDGKPLAIHEEYRQSLPEGVEWVKRKRQEFYAEASSPDTTLVIATGEERRFANILLTIGVVKPKENESPGSQGV